MDRRGPVRQRMDQICADGEWHERGDLLAALTPLVPASRAIRARRRSVNDLRKRRGSVSHRPVSLDQEVAIGAQREVRQVIATAVTQGPYERRGELIRRIPQGDS